MKPTVSVTRYRRPSCSKPRVVGSSVWKSWFSHRDVRAGERVQQRRLADVRVAGERDRRRLGAPPLLAPRRALALELLQAPPQLRDAPAREPAVGLELRLTRAARADAAAEALEVLPHAAHAREVVLELGELDLQLSLGARRVLGEDVEDQLRPVDDARVERVLEEPLLRGIELVVDDHALGSLLAEALLQLLELALADVGALRRPGAMLHDFADRLDACGAGKLLDLGELVAGVYTLSQYREDEPALGLRGTWNHRPRLCPLQPRFRARAADARARRHPLGIEARSGFAPT